MSSAEGLAPDGFARLVAARLKSLGATELTFDAKAFSLSYRTASGSGGANLQNAYLEARAVAPADVVKVLDRHYKQLPVTEHHRNAASFEAAAPQLMPVVRDVRYFGISALQLRNSYPDMKDPPAAPYRPIAGEVVLALFLDAPDSMAQVQQAQLDDWGVSFDQALERAMVNLRSRTQPKFGQVDEGLFVSVWNDDYDPSRLLLTDLLHELPIKGPPVVAMPSRNKLLVAGFRDAVALDKLVQLTANLIETEQRRMTAQLLRFDKDKWVVFDERLPSTSQLKDAAFKLLHGDYSQQKDLLESILASEKRDVFVATFQGFQARDGSGLVSLAQWTKNVESLLPQADRMALLDMDTKEMIIVAWPFAASVLGAQLQPQGMHPERYLVSGFPDEAQLARLRAGALTVTSV